MACAAVAAAVDVGHWVQGGLSKEAAGASKGGLGPTFVGRRAKRPARARRSATWRSTALPALAAAAAGPAGTGGGPPLPQPRPPRAHVRQVATNGTELIAYAEDPSDDEGAAAWHHNSAAVGIEVEVTVDEEEGDLAPASISKTTTSATFAVPVASGFNNKELRKLLKLLPLEVRQRLDNHPDLEELIEIVLDLGRQPIARFPSGDEVLGNNPVTLQDLQYAIEKVGDFGEDNRAGIDRTLHRISAIRNRRGRVVGLTCRVGRAIKGSAAMVRDLVETGSSLLLMGRPGVGKTTAIREIARLLADDYGRRVVIVDTSNEIGGDGDIPHPGVGRARRMQVPSPELQHQVMIEAVENHMPQVIVIDEIGTELECLAARTIAQRGVQLVATAHGNTIDNLIKNPSLQDLVGGIASVTLGDEEARRRGVQKSVLERKAPPTFTCAVEMIETKSWRVHTSVAQTVDSLLSSNIPRVEVRTMTDDNNITVSNEDWMPWDGLKDAERLNGRLTSSLSGRLSAYSPGREFSAPAAPPAADIPRPNGVAPPALQLFTYSISEEALEQVVDALGMGDAICLTDDINSADAVLALRSRLRQNTWVRETARERSLPIYAIKANTMAQMVRAVRTILGIDPSAGSAFGSSTDSPLVPRATAEDEIDALEEARLVVEQIVIPKSQPAELLPRSQEIMHLQMKLVEGYQLRCELCGHEPNCRLRILPAFEQVNGVHGGAVSDAQGVGA
eukprot:jgi/Chlat1/7080/Chrsp57S06770